MMTIVKLVTVNLLSKNVIGLQKFNKANKEFWWSFYILKSLQSICSEHIKPVHTNEFYPLKNQNC